MALYLFARALQCAYNASKARGWWHMWGSHWPHGDSLLFAVTTAQVMCVPCVWFQHTNNHRASFFINVHTSAPHARTRPLTPPPHRMFPSPPPLLGMQCGRYAYAMRPDTLPQSYYKFIVQTGPIAPFALEQTRAQVRGLPVDARGCVQFMHKHTGGKSTAAAAAAAVPQLSQWRNPNSARFAQSLCDGLAVLPPGTHSLAPACAAYPKAMPCGFLHPQHRLCSMQALHTWLDGFKRTFPLYLSLNLVPLAVLKFKAFLQRPATMLQRAVVGAARSSTFMACFVSGYMATICGQRRVMGHDHKLAYWGAGLVASLAVLLEAKSRRSGGHAMG